MSGRNHLLGAALLSGLAIFATMGTPVTPVQAADIIEPVVPAPYVPPVVVPTWRGFYLGGFVSGHWGEVDVEGRRRDDLDLRGIDFQVDIDGILGGVVGGWNFQAGSWVFGVEGDWGWGEIDGTSTRRFATELEDVSLRFKVDDFDIHQAAHIRGRIGWAGWHPNFLLFAAGGGAFAEGQLRVLSTLETPVGNFRIPLLSGFDEQWHTGWTVGGGFDWKITPHFVLRAEYLFDMYGNEDYEFKGNRYNVDIDHIHTVRGALIWKF